MELDAPHFRVVFPRELHDDAQRVAATLEAVYEPASATLGVQPARIPVLLNNRSVVANGYVALGPRRTVWETTPLFPGNQSLLAAGNWLDLLAVHEYRHVAQFARMNRGMSRLARIVFGDYGLGASVSYAVPLWFWEGDAVGIETAHTVAGRGRTPAFDMHFRALLLEGRSYNYAKSRFRSYRDFVPGHYPYGYLMTTHVRRRYGASAWRDIISRSASWSYVPLMFPISVKRTTGRGLFRLHRDAMAELDLFWRQRREGLTYTATGRINDGVRRRWTNFAHPVYVSDSTLVAVQSGLREAADLVLLERGRRNVRLRAVDRALYFRGFDANAEFVVWSQERTHPRFSSLGYAVIMRQDINSRRTTALTRRSRLFVPSISPDGTQVAAVVHALDGSTGLVVLDATTGAELFSVESPDGRFVSEVTWSRDGTALFAVVQDEHGKQITRLDLGSYNWTPVYGPTFDNVWGIEAGDDVVYFVSDQSGIDNIFAADLSDGTVYRVVSRPLGAYYPNVSPDGQRLAFSDYTVDGFDVVDVKIDRTQWVVVSESTDRAEYFDPVVEQEPAEVLEPGATRPETPYRVRSYRRVAGAFAFHSWVPAFDEHRASLALRSDNLLRTFSTQLAALYDRRENTLLGLASTTYSGFLPVLSASARHGGRTSSFSDSMGETRSYAWDETGMSLRMAVPLVFRRGLHTTGIQISGVGSWFRVRDRSFVPFLEQGNGHLASVGASLSISRRQASAYSDFNPPSLQSLVVAAQSTTGRSDFGSQKLYGSAVIVTRGLGRQHRIRVAAEAELERPDNYRYSSILRYSRGFDYRYADNLLRLTGEYAFPLAYPDLSIGNWLYVPRLLAAAFYDHTIASRANSSFSESGDFRSAGAELFVEFYALSIPVPFRLGVRGGYRLDGSDYFVEPVVFSFVIL